jgi:Uma2 family endonuclease
MATTEATTETEPEVGVEAEFPPHRMTIDRYQRLVEAGVYGSEDPVFLWKGRLVEKMTKGRPHSFTSMSLDRSLILLIPEGWHVEHECPLAIGGDSMPEPDVMVVRGSPRDYLQRVPTARDVAMVVEVADSSVAQDSVTKFKAYAADGVPIYWIVNLVSRRIEVYASPSGPAETPSYGERREYGPDDEVPVVLDGREVGRISAKEILP